jgi:UDP-N-acetylmuramyl pentapeptide phosphotransferase/UDP-N-acetylglucosamine-1-phosphate transferase
VDNNYLSDIIFIPDSIRLIAGFLSALIITYVSVPTIIKISDYKQLYAFANERTSHTAQTPTLGGLAVFAGFTLAVIIFSHRDAAPELAYILGALITIFFIGLKDDILVIDPRKKLLGQILASMIVIWLGRFLLSDFHHVFGIGKVSFMISLIFTLFVFLVIINGFNLIDGIDGLASGIGFLASAFYGTWFILAGSINYAILSLSLAGALISFFRFNVFGKKNKIFLGDTGSMIIGFIIAVLTVKFLESNLTVSSKFRLGSAPAVAISLLIVPFFDTLRIVFLRLKSGKSPFRADHNHIHHILLTGGHSHLSVTLMILFINILLIFLVLLFQDLGSVILTFLMLTFMIVFIFVFPVIRKVKK